MKKQNGFIFFIKKYYEQTGKEFKNEDKNKKSPLFKIGTSFVMNLTKKDRRITIIVSYIAFYSMLLLGVIFAKTEPGWYLLVMVWTPLHILNASWYKFNLLYYFILYVRYYKKIDNDNYSINEQIISEKILFTTNNETFWRIVNKYYIVTYCSDVRNKVHCTMKIRKKEKKNRVVFKEMLITQKAIYFEGAKIFDKLYDISALDEFLKQSLHEY